MKSFSDYYQNNKKEYSYKLKIAMCDMEEDKKACLEKCLKKYDMSGSLSFKKTPLQENPMDFPNIRNSEVYIAEVTILYPASPEALRQELSDQSGINLSQIAVYSKNDPRLADEQNYLDRNSPEFKENYKTVLGNEQEWPEEAPYGDAYNKDFLKDLVNKKKERREDVVTNSLIPDQKVDASTHSGEEQGKQNNKAVLNKTFHRVENNKKNTMMSRNKE